MRASRVESRQADAEGARDAHTSSSTKESGGNAEEEGSLATPASSVATKPGTTFAVERLEETNDPLLYLATFTLPLLCFAGWCMRRRRRRQQATGESTLRGRTADEADPAIAMRDLNDAARKSREQQRLAL